MCVCLGACVCMGLRVCVSACFSVRLSVSLSVCFQEPTPTQGMYLYHFLVCFVQRRAKIWCLCSSCVFSKCFAWGLIMLIICSKERMRMVRLYSTFCRSLVRNVSVLYVSFHYFFARVFPFVDTKNEIQDIRIHTFQLTLAEDFTLMILCPFPK